MRLTNPRLLIPTLFAALLGLLIYSQSTAAQLDTSIPVRSPEAPILVELFTSEGCSSCPPADRLFSRLSGDVIQLGFHVDYWNHLGWRDPFSDSRWSDRQRRYSGVFESGYVYTPQLVVNGQAEAVGSDLRKVRSMLEEAASRKPLATLELAVERGPEGFAVAVDGLLAQGAKGPAALLLAVTESGFEIDVKSGENAHRRLSHQHVVRDLHELGRLSPGERVEQAILLPIKEDWKANHLSVVAFVQDPTSLEIHGSALWQRDG